MRKKNLRFLAWLLTISMFVTAMPFSLAEGSTEVTSDSMEVVLQPIDISSDDGIQLDSEEVQKYQQIANELSQTGEQLSVQNEDGVIVYTLKEENSESDSAVVQEFNYSADDSAILSLESYSEISVPSASDSQCTNLQASPDEGAQTTDTQSLTEEPSLESAEEQPVAFAEAVPTSEKQTEFENEYKNTQQTVITAEELLNNILAGDEFSYTFAKRLGLGGTKEETINALQTIVTEYYEQFSQDVDFEQPRFIINGVDIVLNETVEELSLVRNDDGTYSVSAGGTDQIGYRTNIMIDADASVTIIYDEKGEAKIERKVVSGKPTDFVITLDISGSMNWDGRDTAMLSALQVVLDEILAVKENTVSIVFWAEDGAAMQISTSQDGVLQVFSGKDGLTAKKIFDSNLVNANGDETSTSLSEATIKALESIYRTGSGTNPDEGLKVAYDLLDALESSEDRNIGLMLFTDGAANYRSSEYATVSYEKEIAEKFGATIVNVSVGDEYDVKQYERYLDPKSDSYYEKDNETLQENVLYYNIPKLSNQELADRVSEMFEIAFMDIVTETKELQTETVTDGVLAAYGAHLIQTIPAGFELVELRSDDNAVSYQVNGVDAEGNTTISFNLDEILSQKDVVLSYCVIPTQADNDIGVTAYFDQGETLLYAKPVDRIQESEATQEVTIAVTKLSQTAPDRAELPGTHQHVFTKREVLLQRYKEFNSQQHYVYSVEIQLSCVICGEKGDIITESRHGSLEPHQIRGTHCILCGYVGADSGITLAEKRYYEHLMNHIHAGENPLEDRNNEFVQILRERLRSGGLSDAEVNKVVSTLSDAPAKYRDLYLMALFNYSISRKKGSGSLYTTSWGTPSNSITLGTSFADNFITTFCHESGHAIERNLQFLDDKDKVIIVRPDLKSSVFKIQEALFDDVRALIRQEVITQYGSTLSDESIVDAFVNGDAQEKGLFGSRKVHDSIKDDKMLSEVYKSVRDSLESKMKQTPASNANMVRDIIGGVTNNKIYCGGGHSDKNYWYEANGNVTYLQEAEAWAEFFAAKILNDETRNAQNARYFPTATVELENMADQLYNYYLDYYTNTYSPYAHDINGLRVSDSNIAS